MGRETVLERSVRRSTGVVPAFQVAIGVLVAAGRAGSYYLAGAPERLQGGILLEAAEPGGSGDAKPVGALLSGPVLRGQDYCRSLANKILVGRLLVRWVRRWLTLARRGLLRLSLPATPKDDLVQRGRSTVGVG